MCMIINRLNVECITPVRGEHQLMRKSLALMMLLALMLTTGAGAQSIESGPAPSPALTAAPEGAFAALPAVVSNPYGPSLNLCNFADDYDVPMATYFNGVPLTILAVEPTYGDYPVQFGDEGKLWAKVQIGKTDSFPGIEGMMPLAGLLIGKAGDASALPAGSLQDKAALFENNGLDDKSLGEFPAGTRFETLGILDGWAQVRIGEQTGFISLEIAQFDEASLGKVTAALPLDFDQIQPGYQERYDAYMDKLMKLYAEHGDSNHWPLEVSAQASELAQSYGYVFGEVVNVLPGDKDLKPDRVIELAKQHAFDQYAYDPSGWASVSLAFYHLPGLDQEKTWKASLWSGDGTRDVKIWMDTQGKLVHSLSHENMFAAEDETSGVSPAMEETLEYYLWGRIAQPESTEMNQETARQKAWEVFVGQTGDKDEAEYQVESTFHSNDAGDRRWWLVTFLEDYGQEVVTAYHVALVMPEGVPAYHSDLKVYQEDLAWAQRMQEFNRLEENKGPFYTWTLEDKATWESEYFGLPAKDEIAMDKAIRIADQELKTAFQLTDADLERFVKGLYFVISPIRQWQIVYLWDGPPSDLGDPGYTVIINADDGAVTDLFGNDYGE